MNELVSVVVLDLIAPIVNDLMASLPDSWPVARCQFTTLNLSDRSTSFIDRCKQTPGGDSLFRYF
jgi:hypothetical protein